MVYTGCPCETHGFWLTTPWIEVVFRDALANFYSLPFYCVSNEWQVLSFYGKVTFICCVTLLHLSAKRVETKSLFFKHPPAA